MCSREQAKSECDWVMMSSVFVASQSNCFFLISACSRERVRLEENGLNIAHSWNLNSLIAKFRFDFLYRYRYNI
jgi:hypothetical protein